MKKLFKNSLVLATMLTIVANVQAETVALSEVDGVCPSTEINYLSNLTTFTQMEGTGTINEGWDADKYAFTPGKAGTLKVHFSANGALPSIKIDSECNGNGMLRSTSKADHGEQEFRVTADQTIHIALWDWTSGLGYPFNLNVKFTPDIDDGGDGGDGGGDGGETNDNITIYEDAQNSNTEGWINLSSEPGRVTNITDIGTNRVIRLTGSTTDNQRAAYTFKNDNGSLWNNRQNFIAKWDMKTSDDYELFFIAKSSDDPSIDNYIGYVSVLPETEGYTFNEDTGYWSSEEDVQYSWGRYSYIVLGDDTSSGLTTITKDLSADASSKLGITLTSIESIHVNVYGDRTKTLLLDNISLQKEPDATNTTPVADALSVSLDEDTNLSITLTGSDLDSDTLTFTIVDSPTNGTLTGTAPAVLYTPNANYNGADSFTFKVNDGTVDSETVTVSITIVDVAEPNTPPVATPKSVTVVENGSVDITLEGTDDDGDTLTYEVVTNPINGTFDGTTYTPTADYNGTDSFTFTASDGNATSAPATITITITDVPITNTAPVANADNVSLDEDTTLDITLTANDADGNNLTYIIVDNPINGVLSGTVPNITYTPEENFNGSDSFTFKVNDGTVDSETVTVSITIVDVAEPNTVPVAQDKNVTVEENDSIVITLEGTDADNDDLTYAIATGPNHGDYNITTSTYRPNQDYNGTDSFTFTASDGNATSAPATVNITITNVPVQNEDRTVYEDAEDGDTLGWVVYRGAVEDTTINNVFDTDKDNNVIEFNGNARNNGYRLGNNANRVGDWNNTSQFNINWSMKYSERYTVYVRVETNNGTRNIAYSNTDTAGSKSGMNIHHGLGSDTTDGTWRTFTRDLQADLHALEPDNNITSVNAFLIRGSGRVDDISLFSIAQVEPNNPPIAQDQNVSLDENNFLAITLIATDSDNDDLTYSIATQPQNGTLDLVGAIATYTPNRDYNGTDSFTFTAFDGNETSQPATVNIVINNVETIVEITENEELSEHFVGMSIDVNSSTKTVITGTITPDWDVDRYSFDSNSLGEVSISVKDAEGQDIPFYVIKNYFVLLSESSAGNYDLGTDFSLITIMVIAENSEDLGKAYTITIED